VTTRPASGLLEALQQIPDPRGRQGLRHSLPAMLAAVTCAVMSGYTSYAAIAQWIHAQEVSFWHLIGFTRRPPKEDAVRKLLNRLDPQEVEKVLDQWMDQVEGLSPSPIEEDSLRLESLDGKTLRGTRGKWERARQVITLMDNATGRIRAEVGVPLETNENKAAVKLLKSLLLKGKIVVADAGFCQRDFCETVLEQEGEYLVLVKDNQSNLHQEVRQAFEIPRAFSPLPSEVGDGCAANCDNR
jgi:hypothetical protein